MDTLQGHGPADFTELCLILSGQMIYLGEVAATPEEGYTLAKQCLQEGRGYDKLLQMVQAQKGSLAHGLPQAQHRHVVCAEQSGTVQAIQAKEIGHCSMLLGAGRECKDASIDLTAGIMLHKKTGDTVQAGEALATLHYNDAYKHRAEEVAQKLQHAYTIETETKEKTPLVWKII